MSTSIDFPNVGFIFHLKISPKCEIFNMEPLKSSLNNLREIDIVSEWFKEHDLCNDECSNVLVQFANLLKPITKKQYIIASKFNPLHDDNITDFDPSLSQEEWTDNMIMRMYLADAQLLKEENVILSRATAIIYAKSKVDLDNIFIATPVQ